jgi:hypothetical protein
MNTREATASLMAVMNELVNGTAPTGGYLLNRGDVGIVRAMAQLTAREASHVLNNGSSIAAHIAHVTYYTQIMNRWAAGENPWDTANWEASWLEPSVTSEEWELLKRDLSKELNAWNKVLGEPREVTEAELSSMIASIAHLAYHLGAIRQMDRRVRGPGASRAIEAATAPESHL